MKMIRWSFNNLHVPMIQTDEKILSCTTKQLADSLGVTEDSLRMLKVRNSEEFRNLLSITSGYAKDFFIRHKTELGIKRVRKDMLLWSEDEMIIAAILVKSKVAREFRLELLKFVKENARRGYVTQEDHNKTLELLGQYIVRTENLEKILTPNKRVQLQLVN